SIGPHPPRLLPGASGDEPDALFVAAANASGPPRLANGRSDIDHGDRDRYELWFLGIRALFGGVSVALRGIALGSAAAAARRSSTAKKYRLALAISGICIVSVGSVNLPWALHISGRHRGPSGRDLTLLACRTADAGQPPGPTDAVGRREAATRGYHPPQPGRTVPSADGRPLCLEPGGAGSTAAREIRCSALRKAALGAGSGADPAPPPHAIRHGCGACT